MEKDIDRIPKNSETDIVIRIDDFGGRRGVTIREFVKSERYTGFTKAGTRIPADKFKIFKASINSIDENDLEGEAEPQEYQQKQNYQQQEKPSYQNSHSQDFSGKKEVKKKAKVQNMEEVEF
jgi:hypothetical protein